MNSFRFVDVSGLGNAGKTAVVDFLKGFESIHASEFSFEFDLIRLPNGIIDLHHHLVEDWSPVRSNYALRAFEDLCFRMAGSEKRKNLKAFFLSSGQGYQSRFKGHFLSLSQSYLRSFILDEYKAFWPYYLIEDSPLVRAYKKTLLKLKAKKKLLSPIYLADGKDFSQKTTQFVTQLFSNVIPKDKNWVVLNNTFEPFNPEKSLNILNDSKAILVYRDPRDVYVSGLNAYKAGKDAHLQAFDNNGINKSFLGGDNIETFIKRQNLYFSKLTKSTDPRLKIIRFEDFVLNHEAYKKDLIEFLGLEADAHKEIGKYFQPEKSAQNIGIWKKYSNQKEIKYIEDHLDSKWILFGKP
jgi:hypothetical protein